MTIAIPLTQGKVALISDDAYDRVSQHSWCAIKDRFGRFYAQSRINGHTITLHRFLMQPPTGFEVDHKNHDTLNCEWYNMRTVTHANNSKNMRRHRDNSSGFKGVDFHKQHGKYRARIMVTGVVHFLGLFTHAEDAARAYDAAACQYHGEFASLNFPDEWRWIAEESRWENVAEVEA